jgi:hypothetical protein
MVERAFGFSACRLTACRVSLSAAALGLLASSSAPSSRTSWSQEAYVWQRVWTANVQDALRTSPSQISGWRVLASLFDATGRASGKRRRLARSGGIGKAGHRGRAQCPMCFSRNYCVLLMAGRPPSRGSISTGLPCRADVLRPDCAGSEAASRSTTASRPTYDANGSWRASPRPKLMGFTRVASPG